MYNRYYSYDNIDLWDGDAWKDYFSPVRYLFLRVEEINHERFRVQPHTGAYEGRTDGIYNAKTMSNFYQEYIDRWAARGMYFHATEMGSVCWTAMIPDEVRTGQSRAPKVLVVLGDADYSDPNWMIHALIRNDDITDMAAAERMVVLYINMNGVNYSGTPFGVIQEFSVIYNLLMDHLYLDVRPLEAEGVGLDDIEGYSPDGTAVEDLNGIPVVEISHRWQNMYSGVMDIGAGWLQHPLFDKDAFIHSPQGRAAAESLAYEHRFDTLDSGAFTEYWRSRGLEITSHDYKDYQWISCVPLRCSEQAAGEKLPVMLIFIEVTYQDPHQPITACAVYHDYLELAAAGEMILLFFALESPDANDMFYPITLEAAQIYPIDLSRVYVTGQSHNGYFAERFAHTHHDKVAAVAPLGIHPGFPEPEWSTSIVPVTDEMVEEAAGFDMPTIVITSRAESRNGRLHCRQDDEQFSSAARAWQRRMKAQRCRVPSVEEINAALTDHNTLRARIGFPVDSAREEYHFGAPVYIGDLVNAEGKNHFRLAMLENNTHIISAQMPEISWEFLKRFARDIETGETIELY